MKLALNPVRLKSRLLFVGLLAVYVSVRVYLGLLPGWADDVNAYKSWAHGAANTGLVSAYETTEVDYPPLCLYIYYPVGKIYLALGFEDTAESLHESGLATLLIKTPQFIFDLLLAGLIYWLVASYGVWGQSRSSVEYGRLAALLYLWNPAVLWGPGYWGQPDSIHTALAVGAFAVLGSGRLVGPGMLLAAASLMKPLAAPLAPLLLVAAFMRRGFRGFLMIGLGGLAAGVLIFLPFIVTGRAYAVFERVLLDLDSMAFTSSNGHNLWWVLGGWHDSGRPMLWLLTPKMIGLVLFLLAYGLLLVRSRTWMVPQTADETEYRSRIFLLGAAVSCSFFFLSTHMHENHMFLSVPLLLLVAGRGRVFAWLAAGCSLAVCFNMMIHDPALLYSLPSPLDALSGYNDPQFNRPYTWLQIVGMWFNSALVTCVVVTAYVSAWRRKI